METSKQKQARNNLGVAIWGSSAKGPAQPTTGAARWYRQWISTFAMGHFSRGGWVTFVRQGGRVSPRVAERVLSFIKALDSAFKTLESCDNELLHHPQFTPMLFRWLRRHKGGASPPTIQGGVSRVAD